MAQPPQMEETFGAWNMYERIMWGDEVKTLLETCPKG